MKKILIASIASIASIALVTATQAAVEKHDVCHYEGNGNYHVINVSYKAVPAHTNHGDALPGEPVPTNPGFVFDENCEQVTASSCPCDFSATGLTEVGLDGSSSTACAEEIPGNTTRLYSDPSSLYNVYVNIGMGDACGRNTIGGNFLEGFSISAEERDSCLNDLSIQINDLNLPTCQ